ncbi:hypothetical protein [Burkholderia multivorans]|uniref:hypothetical protein n=1 Tax=Burkholderia multivorans TaxID=87883 RepID=UPI0011309BA1|nr:hypothetical protein [Burkholderia multivorans]MDN7743629.1 hypothetical protein [Burkholderia multivorans]UQP00393.1 hypothetical protein L0Z36_16120 [Burkholderia multivorans]
MSFLFNRVAVLCNERLGFAGGFHPRLIAHRDVRPDETDTLRRAAAWLTRFYPDETAGPSAPERPFHITEPSPAFRRAAPALFLETMFQIASCATYLIEK